MFDSRKCKIKENNSGRLVATATRRPNNIYILDMKERERIQKPHKRILRKKMSQRPKIRMKYY
jgi:hypothetical protein